MGRKWATIDRYAERDGTVRSEGIQVRFPHPSSPREQELCGRGTPYSSASLPVGRPGGPLVWGRLLGVFTSGSTFCRCSRWPRPEGHAESTCGRRPVRAPSYLRTGPLAKALPT